MNGKIFTVLVGAMCALTVITAAQAAEGEFLIQAPISIEGQMPPPPSVSEEGGKRLLNPARSGRFVLTQAGESQVVVIEYDDNQGVIVMFTLVPVGN